MVVNVEVQRSSIGDGESSARMIAKTLHNMSVSPHLIPKIIIAPTSVERAQIDAYGIVLIMKDSHSEKWTTRRTAEKRERRP